MFCRASLQETDKPSPPTLQRDPFVPMRRVVIWFKHDCIACQVSGPIFDAVEQYGRSPLAQPPFFVERREVDDATLQQYPHVQMVPMYDIVDSSEGEDGYQPYEPAVPCPRTPRLRSTRPHLPLRAQRSRGAGGGLSRPRAPRCIRLRKKRNVPLLYKQNQHGGHW